MKKCYQRKKWPQKTKPVDKQITHIEFSCTNIEIWLDINCENNHIKSFFVFLTNDQSPSMRKDM